MPGQLQACWQSSRAVELPCYSASAALSVWQQGCVALCEQGLLPPWWLGCPALWRAAGLTLVPGHLHMCSRSRRAVGVEHGAAI